MTIIGTKPDYMYRQSSETGEPGGIRTHDPLIKSQMREIVEGFDFTIDCFGTIVPINRKGYCVGVAKYLDSTQSNSTNYKRVFIHMTENWTNKSDVEK